MNRRICLLVLFIFVSTTNSMFPMLSASSQLPLSKDSTKYSREDSLLQEVIDRKAGKTSRHTSVLGVEDCYKNNLFIAGGGGLPQGLRGEFGFHVLQYISLGFSFNIFDNWSKDPAEGMIGLFARLNFPIEKEKFIVYLILAGGGTFTIFGEGDSYTQINLGIQKPLTRWFSLRFEAGVDNTTYRYRGDKLYPDFHLGMEIELFNIFK